MDSSTTYLLSACVGVGLVLFLRRYRPIAPLPPSPRADPIIGHLRVYSRKTHMESLNKWADECGDIFHLRILGHTLVVLNTVEAAIDLLDKRGINYSDRPMSTVLEMLGWEANFAFIDYGPQWKKHRKMFQEYFSFKKCLTYQDSSTREARRLLKNLVTSPHHFMAHIKILSLSNILRITYGHRVESKEDAYVELQEAAMHSLKETIAGVPLLDLFPALKYLPRWFPGVSSLAAVARRWRPAVRRFYDFPINDVRKQMEAGIAQPSFVSNHLERLDSGGADGVTLADVRGVAGITLLAGGETPASQIQIFFLAMLFFPEEQRKAQEEIDRVVGSRRLPESKDRESLPFVECVLQETMRWHPIAPLGVAHKSRDDDIYNGMFIPAGSIMIPNLQAMSRDERVYKDAERFYPERFLPAPAGRGEPHLTSVFGFGRRLCPGRPFADNSIWLAVAHVLATMNISKAVGPDGNVIEPKAEFVMIGLTSQPKPFKCDIRPRSEEAMALILQNYN